MPENKIPILWDHNNSRVIGKIENNIIEFFPGAKITPGMLFNAINGGLIIIEDEWVDDKTQYIKKAQIMEVSICPVVK